MNAPAQSPPVKARLCRSEREDDAIDPVSGDRVLVSNATIGCTEAATHGDYCEEHRLKSDDSGAPYIVEGPASRMSYLTFDGALAAFVRANKTGWARLLGRDADGSASDHFDDGLTEVERELLGEVE
jgi:hypothetical protein